MAEEKKGGDKKPSAPANGIGGLDATETLIAAFIILSIIGFIFNRLSSGGFGELTFFGFSFSNIGKLFGGWFTVFKFISFFLSGVFFVIAVTLSQMTGAVVVLEKKKLYPQGEPQISDYEPTEEINPMKERWQEIKKHSESNNPAEWRIAIIEADIILEELLDTMNLPGETIGDKLKAVEKSDFLTLDYAWEAHKARNSIAHEGKSFELNERQVRHIISLFEAVFKEFYLI